jgi:hypothetical protein
MSESNVASTAPAPAEKTSRWEDFIDILFSPSSVFRRREHDSWLMPMVILTLAVAVIVFASRGVMQPVFDAEFEKAAEQMRRNPQITEDIIEKSRGMMQVTAMAGSLVIFPISVFIIGFMTWLVGKLVDSTQDLHAALVVATYAMVPRVIQSIANAVQGLLLKPEQLNGLTRLSFSPARFVDPATTSPVVLQLLNRLDLFTIWVTVLLAIGLHVTGRVSKQRAVIAGILFWVIGSIPAILGALRQAR